VDITGGTPSAIRAFLMVMFLHASHVLRLPGNPLSALVASAVCVLVVQPMQLFSASFQLSYGIVVSLLLLGLPLGEHWTEKWALFSELPKVSWCWYHHAVDWSWRKFLGVLAIGLSTTVISTISGVVIFKLFTPISLLANLALIPLGSLVIISGFLSLLCGLVGLGWIVTLLNHVSILILLGIEKGVQFFVSVPGAFHAAEFNATWLGYSAFAGLLGVIFFGYANHWEIKRGGYWVPFAFTFLVLLAGMRFIAS
jgi:competence protein ComEC